MVHYAPEAGEFYIMDGSTIIATLERLGPETERYAYAMGASMELLAACEVGIDRLQHVALASQGKFESSATRDQLFTAIRAAEPIGGGE